MERMVDTSSTEKLDKALLLAPTFKVMFSVLALFMLEAVIKSVMNEESVSFKVIAIDSHTSPISAREKRQAAVVFPVWVKFQLSSSNSSSNRTERPCDVVDVVTFTTCEVDEMYLQLLTSDCLNALRCPGVNALAFL